ncbi:MAG: SDR family NAD(P)-dependent oxidoreductase [Jiangellales bacterium]
MQLANRVVLVTGASSGIGAATARAMSGRGATVLLVARRQAALHEVAASLPGRAEIYPCDVGDPDAVSAMAARVRTDVGVPDVIVNNAGAGRWLWIEETSNEEFLAQVAVPFHAAFFVTRAFIEPMLDRRSGWVVNVNSPASAWPWPGAIGYAASRWGLRGFDEGLAADLRGTGIGVTAVVAGRTDSDYFTANPGALERLPTLDKLYRRLSPDHVAQMIVRGVERERRSVVEPLEIRLTNLAARVAPRGVTWLLGRTGATRSVRTGARARTP